MPLQSNILISDDLPPRALLGDFGLNTIVLNSSSLTGAPIDWTAPELLIPDDASYQPSPSSDIYALGMVIYEVSFNSPEEASESHRDQALTGTRPFASGGKTELACKIVLEHERPPRPRDSEKLGLTDEIWEVLQKCWGKVPPTRPSVDIVSACLKRVAGTWAMDVPAFMLASKAGIDEVMNMKGDQAKDFANKLDEVR